jgi:phosphatidylglycerophosphate synthase
LLAAGTYAHALAGTALFWAAVIVDGCDGEVARLELRETRFGYLLDVTTDNVVHAAIFLGLGIGVYRASPDEVHGFLPILFLAGFASALLATWYCLIRHPPVARLAPRTRRGRIRRGLLRGFEALMNRDFAYLLLLLALLNRLYWFLWAAAFGTYVYSAGLVWVYRWRDAE